MSRLKAKPVSWRSLCAAAPRRSRHAPAAGANPGERRGSRAAGDGGMVAQLTFPAESDASIGGLINYNPYAPKQQTKTWLYEPLMVQNSLDCEVTPWLATGYKWEGANKLTFDIRDGREVERRLGLHRRTTWPSPST